MRVAAGDDAGVGPRDALDGDGRVEAWSKPCGLASPGDPWQTSTSVVADAQRRSAGRRRSQSSCSSPSWSWAHSAAARICVGHVLVSHGNAAA